VAAFNGGESWMVALDYVPLPPAASLPQQLQQAQRQEQRQEQRRRRQQPSAGDGASRLVTAAAWEQAESGAAELTAEAWQQQQLQRLAAVRQMHCQAAVVLPPAFYQQPGAAWLSPAHCLLSSAELAPAGGAAGARAALESVGLPAFSAALSVHLNGLASAPADAFPEHVQRSAAGQQLYLAAESRRPLLCAAQLQAAFGRQWLADLQVSSSVAHACSTADLLISAAEVRVSNRGHAGVCTSLPQAHLAASSQAGLLQMLPPAALRQAPQPAAARAAAAGCRVFVFQPWAALSVRWGHDWLVLLQHLFRRLSQSAVFFILHECKRWHYTQASMIAGSEESAIYESRGRNWAPPPLGVGPRGTAPQTTT
jgi:hypothetical protein